MTTTREDIARWLDEGKAKGATHVIVACDTFDREDYPVYVMPGQDARMEAGKQKKVMECYSLSQDLQAQLGETRAFHYD